MLRLFGICSDQHISQFFMLSTYNIHWSKIWTHSVPIVNVHGSKTLERGKQIQGAQAMMLRAKFHKHQTADMREAMDLYKQFLKTL